MMQILDVNKFLLSLAVAIASRSGLVFDTAGQTAPRSLWLHETPERLAADPATSLRIYGGTMPSGLICRPTVSLQQMTLGKDAALVLGQAMLVHQAMLNDAGQPQSLWAIPGKRMNAGVVETDPDRDWEVKLAMPLQRPGIIGRDESGLRWIASGNWDIEFFEKLKNAG